MLCSVFWMCLDFLFVSTCLCCKTEELRYCIPPWSLDSHMQHSLFYKSWTWFCRFLRTFQQLWSGSPITTELIQPIALKLVWWTKAFEWVCGCGSLCMLLDGNVCGCFICRWCMSETLECMWWPFLCVCVYVQSPCFIELVFIICCYMKTVLYLTHDPSIATILHRKWHLTGWFTGFRAEIKDGCMLVYPLVY